MKRKGLWSGIGLVAVLFFGAASLKAAEKTVGEKASVGSSDELEQGSEASAGDGMDQSRFGGDEDDTYTDDSDSLDDLNKSKFQDEKNDDDQGTDTQDQDNP